jgi:predicted nuclease of predicted toxin-antitoxin system
VKLYLDEDISPRVSEILRMNGTDAVSAHEKGMLGASDEEQLAFAVAEDRAMVTRNRDDFVILTVQAFEALKPHKGLIIVPHTIPGSDFGLLATLLMKYAKIHPQGLESYTIDFLSNNVL